MSKKQSTQGLRQKLARLEEIAELLESNELEIERAIELYEEGVKLSNECYETLKNAELKIQTLYEASAKDEEEAKENED